jgi:hypothetical protein
MRKYGAKKRCNPQNRNCVRNQDCAMNKRRYLSFIWPFADMPVPESTPAKCLTHPVNLLYLHRYGDVWRRRQDIMVLLAMAAMVVAAHSTPKTAVALPVFFLFVLAATLLVRSITRNAIEHAQEQILAGRLKSSSEPSTKS